MSPDSAMTHPPPDWERVRDLFASTFEVGCEERQKLLVAEIDAAVRRKVEAMLAAHDSIDGPLDTPALDSIEGLDLSLLEPVPGLLGRRLGPYRIVREVGSGGMG